MRAGTGASRATLGRPGSLAVLLAACIGGDDDARTRTTRGARTVDEGTMRLGIGGPLVVDPAEASLASPSDLMVLDLLYDGLTRLDADGRAAAGAGHRLGGQRRR